MQIMSASFKRCVESDWEKGYLIECSKNDILIDIEGFYIDLKSIHDFRYETDILTLKIKECECNNEI